MSEFILYHGNKNYSSWSMRAWLALRLAGTPFSEVGFHLGESGVREKIRQHSPTAKVPALRHGDLVIWDSLAICEYLAERFPQAEFWPSNPPARAVARSISAEMHSGFPALRTHMPFTEQLLLKRILAKELSPCRGCALEVSPELRFVGKA